MNSIGYVNPLVGKEYNENLLDNYIGIKYKNINNHFGFECKYIYDKNQKLVLTAEEIYFLMLKHSIDGVLKENIVNPTSLVMSVPSYFSKELVENIQKFYDPKITIINEYIGCATLFGMENNDSLNENGRNVMFVNSGYVSTSATCVKYTKQKCDIMSYVFNENLGGRLIDNKLIENISKQIKDEEYVLKDGDKYKIKIMNVMNKIKEKLSADGASDVL